MRSAGFAVRVWRMFQPCFRAVDMTDRMRAKIRAAMGARPRARSLLRGAEGFDGRQARAERWRWCV